MLIERVGQWFNHYDWARGHTLVITHANVIKAAILHVLKAPIQAYWQLDISPLTQTILSVHQNQWRLKSSGIPVGLHSLSTSTGAHPYYGGTGCSEAHGVHDG